MRKLLFVVALVCIVSTVSFAQLGLYSIGAGVGYVSVQNDVGSGVLFGAGADLGELTTGLRLRPEIAYWSVSNDVLGIDVTTSDFVVNANVIYVFSSMGEQTPFYVGGGVGLNNVSFEVYIPPIFGIGGGTVSTSESRFGINVLGGAAFPVAEKIMLGGEARYVIVSDFNHFSVYAVFTYALR